jgi:hypothetical protein
MCDYSLEMYANRPAKAGEKLVTTRFPSGSIGMTEAGSPATAVCLNCGTQMTFVDFPVEQLERFDLQEPVKAEFIRAETGIYRDGLRLSNGVEIFLQQLPCGLTVELSSELPKEITDTLKVQTVVSAMV